MRTQVFDQLGPLGVWPHGMDGRAIRNGFIERTGVNLLLGQPSDELEALKTEFQRGAREKDADTDVIWAGACSALQAHAEHGLQIDVCRASCDGT